MLTGYAGQLSLAQYVIAGVGAFTGAKLISHMPLVPTVLLASAMTAVVGAIVGLPALRTRGATLAVATLGLASAIVAVIFNNTKWTGGFAGITVPKLSLFGWSVDSFKHPDRYAFMTITAMLLIAVMVANLRRGSSGRRMLAVRSNERAAASLGVSVSGVKVYAFSLSAAIATVGGILVAFVQPTVQASNFDVFTCILIVAVTVLGGVGYVPGAAFGAFIIAGGIPSMIFLNVGSINQYLPLFGGVMLTIVLMTGPDGSFSNMLRSTAALRAAVDRKRRRRREVRASKSDAATPVRIAGPLLRVDKISVSFGGVHAVRDVSFDIRPGEVHGLIGPNGAGKTTVIDAITGFARVGSGSVRLGDKAIDKWSARRRAVAGLSRSFQSLELFDDLTVEENLAVASQQHSSWRYLTDLVHPGGIRLTPTAKAAIASFKLTDLLQVRPSSVSFGQRKIVAIARSVATAPSILLLDEPAAGLDDIEADELASLIRSLADEWGIGVLLVEHKVDLIMSTCDRITVLDGGRVIASGSPAEIQADPSVLAAYLGTPDGAPLQDVTT